MIVIRRDAVLSPCKRYRYSLTRSWDPSVFADVGVRVLFVMLNPSTADADRDDPTIRKCMAYARRWGFASLEVVNLFAWRAPDPKQLLIVPDRGEDIVGSRNDEHIVTAVQRAQLVVAAWGKVKPALEPRARHVRTLIGDGARCLWRNGDGSPGHPLYLRLDRPPQPFTAASGGAE